MTPAHSITIESSHALEEQLRYFAFDGAPLPSPDALKDVQQRLSKRQRLATLLKGNLDFHGEDSGYVSHNLHAFAAKFPPQLARGFIRGLTTPGDVILDPMMGSGTAVLEALLEGRHGIGLDIDPLAVRLCRVKTTPVNVRELQDEGSRVFVRANALLSKRDVIERNLVKRFDEPTKTFIDYWFLPDTQRELMALTLAIQDVLDVSVRDFIELTFSSIIVTKSGGVSRARDLAHSRPHLDRTKVPKNALDQFAARLRKNLKSISQLKNNGLSTTTLTGDARCMPFADGSIDLIVTSPPYANAIDYMRAHKFSLVWLGKSVTDLSELRSKYIGSERTRDTQCNAMPKRPELTIRRLAKCDSGRAAVLRKYLSEMRAVLFEMYRVLRADSAAVVVVGKSLMRGIEIQTPYYLTDIAAEIGFDVVGIAPRVLDRNKRMMPARFHERASSMIEQRMREEHVIGLLKPEDL
jgi:DNA modification methylase